MSARRLVLKIFLLIVWSIYNTQLEASRIADCFRCKRKKYTPTKLTTKQLADNILQKEDEVFFESLLSMERGEQWTQEQFEECEKMKADYTAIFQLRPPDGYKAFRDPALPFLIIDAFETALIESSIHPYWVGLYIGSDSNKDQYVPSKCSAITSLGVCNVDSYKKLFGEKIYHVIDKIYSVSPSITINANEIDNWLINPVWCRSTALHEAMHVKQMHGHRQMIFEVLFRIQADECNVDLDVFTVQRKKIELPVIKQQEITAEEFPATRNKLTARLLHYHFLKQGYWRRERNEPIDSDHQNLDISAANVAHILEAHMSERKCVGIKKKILSQQFSIFHFGKNS